MHPDATANDACCFGNRRAPCGPVALSEARPACHVFGRSTMHALAAPHAHAAGRGCGGRVAGSLSRLGGRSGYQQGEQRVRLAELVCRCVHRIKPACRVTSCPHCPHSAMWVRTGKSQSNQRCRSVRTVRSQNRHVLGSFPAPPPMRVIRTPCKSSLQPCRVTKQSAPG